MTKEDVQGGGQAGAPAGRGARRDEAPPDAGRPSAHDGRRFPRADVVVTNPTHFAVALRYDGAKVAPRSWPRARTWSHSTSAASPRSTACPSFRTRRSRARCTRSVQVGQMIPEDFFQAVAQLLAFVYRVAGRKAANRLMDVLKSSPSTPTCSRPRLVVLVVVMMVIPLPPFLVDMLITMNICGALTILVSDDVPVADARLQLVPEPAAPHHSVPGWRSTCRSRASCCCTGTRATS